MSRINPEFTNELIDFLDLQSGHLQNILEFLDAFRKALIRRDLPALQEMQTQFAREAEVCVQLDRTQQSLQKKLSVVIGCPVKQVCLSMLCRHLDSPLREQLQQRQRQLTEQILHVRRQHLATELLLRECARLNRRFLETIVGSCEKGKTYDAHGRSTWSVHKGLMSVKL